VSGVQTIHLCSTRHMKWQRVEGGHEIPAGQPYRIEFAGTPASAHERVHHSVVIAADYHDWFVDASWRPSPKLPQTPTWGILVHKKHGRMFGLWHQTGPNRLKRGDTYATVDPVNVCDFIFCTPEQIERIEAECD
jgi:hypothetical protein